jgi:hypothetical protein
MITLHNAIYSAYPNAGVIRGSSIDSLEVVDKEHNPMTIDAEVVTAELEKLQVAETKAEQDAKDAKASALAKLTALGLTQAEVTALLG